MMYSKYNGRDKVAQIGNASTTILNQVVVIRNRRRIFQLVVGLMGNLCLNAT